MNINILAGGPDELLPDLRDFNGENERWIGVDRGVITLLSKGIKPFAAFGDFDSVTESEWNQIENEVEKLSKFKPEKDETDTELALNWAVEQHPKLIRLFGATGGRADHFLANIQLLIHQLNQGHGCEIEMIDLKNSIMVKKPGEYYIERSAEKKYISFVPVSLEVNGLTLNGFKYPLKDRHISIGSTLCISNELINDHGTFSFAEGILIVVRSQD
ncbi:MULTISPECIES: thiamine diphosphokinase [unclassified Bacillus (in: firmicutes)]|uniref:thiamine diphosphokinase n=1 Tax=unclassified Bacillus (in: firmicutes) TaxID=185979 RepID=UPI0008E2C72E|nr:MULTISPECIES: thiamine diphosphokinase [unclassified Bacillus (in: firmicutes)]SFA74789.1 thiamine diphosphokinase [Bacillus sp. UNCCL13]SFQ64894.1 thiamine diphosphokinase [Bacillus sp. cl95]